MPFFHDFESYNKIAVSIVYNNSQFKPE